MRCGVRLTASRICFHAYGSARARVDASLTTILRIMYARVHASGFSSKRRVTISESRYARTATICSSLKYTTFENLFGRIGVISAEHDVIQRCKCEQTRQATRCDKRRIGIDTLHVRH